MKSSKSSATLNNKSSEFQTTKGKGDILENKRKSIRIDSDIVFKFQPSLKSTPNPDCVSPRLAALKESNLSNLVSRKSGVRKSDARKSKLAKPAAPPVFFSTVVTPKAKTPIKFDLKASLSKPLAYKPHVGKLKEVYFSPGTNKSLPRKPTIKTKEREDRKVSVKQITKNVSTRERRRTEASAKREKSRLVVLDKRRGIVG